MRRHIFLFVGGLLLCTSTMAQSNATTGLVFDRDIISAPSLHSLAQRDYAGTARSMAMGGAFTSLGADMASLGVNPAGFGMYQHNDISVTFGLGVHRAENSGVLGAEQKLNTQTRFSINNIGASFKVYEGTGDLLAINFAFGYNKVADYNYNLNYHGASGSASIADAFADIANRNGLGINGENHICDQVGYSDFNMNPYYWNQQKKTKLFYFLKWETVCTELFKTDFVELVLEKFKITAQVISFLKPNSTSHMPLGILSDF